MSKSDLKRTFSTLIMLIILSPFSCEITDNELANSYKAFLNEVMSSPKQVNKRDDFITLDKIQKGTPESAYERVIRNLRTNWEMPVNYLQKRGYLTKLDPKRVSQNNDLSMDAYNLINGPLLNPSTFKNLYPIPRGPNSLPSIKRERSNKSNKENENDGSNKIRSFNLNLLDCNNPNMYSDLACLDQYLGSNWIKDKWQTWFNKNQSTTTTSTTSTSSTTTSSTTISPTTLSTDIPNTTTKIVSDSSIQDAQDGLEFFKIYNDFMLAKLASKLSQNAPEQRMLNSAQSTDQNTFPQITSNPTVAPFVPDFPNISENDIKVLKELQSCLKNKKNLTNLDGNIPMIQSDGIDGGVDVADDRRVSSTYLPTKLKFLAHLHHDVFEIGRKKSLRKDQSKLLPNLNANNDCNVDIANLATSNYTHFMVK